MHCAENGGSLEELNLGNGPITVTDASRQGDAAWAGNNGTIWGLVIETVGGMSTMMFTTVEVEVRPKLSVTCAVREYVPAGGLAQIRLYGAVVDTPKLFVP